MSDRIELLENIKPLPPWFRWLPGMAAVDEDGHRWRVYERPGGLSGQGVPRGYLSTWPPSWPARPDYTDSATVGCLVQLLRDVSGDVGAHTDVVTGEWHAWWRVGDLAPIQHATAPTEGEALWAALDAAWAQRGGE